MKARLQKLIDDEPRLRLIYHPKPGLYDLGLHLDIDASDSQKTLTHGINIPQEEEPSYEALAQCVAIIRAKLFEVYYKQTEEQDGV
jgi:hypothetical protein